MKKQIETVVLTVEQNAAFTLMSVDAEASGLSSLTVFNMYNRNAAAATKGLLIWLKTNKPEFKTGDRKSDGYQTYDKRRSFHNWEKEDKAAADKAAADKAAADKAAAFEELQANNPKKAKAVKAAADKAVKAAADKAAADKANLRFVAIIAECKENTLLNELLRSHFIK